MVSVFTTVIKKLSWNNIFKQSYEVFKYIWFSKMFLLLCLILQMSKNMMSLGLKSQCIEVIVTSFPKNHFIFQQAVLCLDDYLHSSKVNLLVEGK